MDLERYVKYVFSNCFLNKVLEFQRSALLQSARKRQARRTTRLLSSQSSAYICRPLMCSPSIAAWNSDPPQAPFSDKAILLYCINHRSSCSTLPRPSCQRGVHMPLYNPLPIGWLFPSQISIYYAESPVCLLIALNYASIRNLSTEEVIRFACLDFLVEASIQPIPSIVFHIRAFPKPISPEPLWECSTK